MTRGAQNIDAGTAELEKLAAELDSKQYAVSLITGQGVRPHLAVTNRAKPDWFTESVYCDGHWFYWGWAERIARVENLGAAVADIARALRIVDSGI